jgi:hypothetical protein
MAIATGLEVAIATGLEVAIATGLEDLTTLLAALLRHP